MTDHLGTEQVNTYTFLMSTFVVGSLAGRPIKNTKDDAVADNVYGTGVPTITLLATYFGGYTWNR